MEGTAHLGAVPLAVILVVPPGVLNSNVMADLSAVAGGKATADVLATTDVEAVVGVSDTLDIPKQQKILLIKQTHAMSVDSKANG